MAPSSAGAAEARLAVAIAPKDSSIPCWHVIAAGFTASVTRGSELGAKELSEAGSIS